jgi:hypothetical protein
VSCFEKWLPEVLYSSVLGIAGLLGGRRIEEVTEAAGLHFSIKGGVIDVLNGLHAGSVGRLDVFWAVVDEEDVGGGGVKRLGGVDVDGGFGLGEVEGVGPSTSVEVGKPIEAGDEAFGHGVADIGEDAGGDAGSLKVLRPGQHREVDLAPEVEIGGDEGLNLIQGQDETGVVAYVVPVGLAGEVAAVVGVAVGPVAAVKGFFVEAGDGAYADPGCGVGRAGQDHTVVKEDCFDGIHS